MVYMYYVKPKQHDYGLSVNESIFTVAMEKQKHLISDWLNSKQISHVINVKEVSFKPDICLIIGYTR